MWVAKRAYLDNLDNVKTYEGSATPSRQEMLEAAKCQVSLVKDEGYAAVVREGDTWLCSGHPTKRSFMFWIEEVTE